MTTATSYQGSLLCDVPSIPRGVVGNQVVGNLSSSTDILLLDTESQVTCVTEEFHNRYLRHCLIQPLLHLPVIGAAGQVVPYKGFVGVNLMFPASYAGTKHEVSTLALVCSNRQGKDYVPCSWAPTPVSGKRCTGVSSSSGNMGAVRCSKSITIKPGEAAEVATMIKNRSRAKHEVFIEKGRASQLPESVELTHCLVELPASRMAKTRVILTNKSCQSVVIPAFCRLASASSIEEKLLFNTR